MRESNIIPAPYLPPRTGALPRDEAWTTLDGDWIGAVTAADADRAPVCGVRGMEGYGKWTLNDNKAAYTHINGTEYAFSQSLCTGSGNAKNRCLYFTPKAACLVTVVYDSRPGRPLFIYQGEKLLSSGYESKRDGRAAVIRAYAEPSERVYIYGGSSGKDLFAVFADYYDIGQTVLKTISGNVDYSGDACGKRLMFSDGAERYYADFDSKYSVGLRQDREYEVRVVNGDGSLCAETAVTLETSRVTARCGRADISLIDVGWTRVGGDITVHDTVNNGKSIDLRNVKITFTAKDAPELVCTAKISGGKFSVCLMPGHTYRISAEGICGRELSELSKEYEMAAGDTKPFKNILITQMAGEADFSDTVRVGKNRKYTRIRDAAAAIGRMNRESGEDGRVTILVDAGVYTEQILIDAPYVTLKAADMNDRPKVRWYYGVGYLYYSAHDGYYSEDYAAAKIKKGAVAYWAPVCRVTGDHVKIEGIIFQNTFNCRVTEEELSDGVEAAKNNEYPDVNGKAERTGGGFDPMAEKATERASAIALEGDHIEVYNCDFISSQDTFYTNGTAYVKDCYIEGGTDYIFGGSSVVFENCTLAWHGFTEDAKRGHITANKNQKPPQDMPDKLANGYLFLNCTVTNSKYYPDNVFKSGTWGRNWGGKNCRVIFDGVTVEAGLPPSGWKEMNGDLSGCVLYVNNVFDAEGNPVDVTADGSNPNGTVEKNDYDPAAYIENLK